MPTAASASIWRINPPMLAAAAAAGILVAATVTLWVYYGSTVFYEMILAGFAACF
jgi:hypothetical protein